MINMRVTESYEQIYSPQAILFSCIFIAFATVQLRDNNDFKLKIIPFRSEYCRVLPAYTKCIPSVDAIPVERIMAVACRMDFSSKANRAISYDPKHLLFEPNARKPIPLWVRK